MTAPDAPRPRGRTAWLVLGGFAAVIGVLLGLGWTLGALANETRTITREFDDDAITTVDVASGSGEVLVVGDREPGTGIEVRTRLTDGLWDGRHSEKVVGDRGSKYRKPRSVHLLANAGEDFDLALARQCVDPDPVAECDSEAFSLHA